MMDISTAEFEYLMQDENLVDEPSAGEERRVRVWRRLAAVIAIAGLFAAAFILGTAIGGAWAWYKIATEEPNWSEWHVGDTQNMGE